METSASLTIGAVTSSGPALNVSGCVAFSGRLDLDYAKFGVAGVNSYNLPVASYSCSSGSTIFQMILDLFLLTLFMVRQLLVN